MSATDTATAAEVVRDLAQRAAVPQLAEPGKIYLVSGAEGTETFDFTGDEWLELPSRKRGTTVVGDVASFAAYFGKHSDPDSEVFAYADGAQVTAVLDAHQADAARWQEHRLTLALKPTVAWTEWLANHQRLLAQMDFAEFIEAHAGDVAPDHPVTSAQLLEIAQGFQAHMTVKFVSGQRLASGLTQLQYEETAEAKAGDRGAIQIPAGFELAIAPYVDCGSRYRLPARFRYRIRDQRLLLGYVLDNPERRQRDAFTEIAGALAAEISVPILAGHPA